MSYGSTPSEDATSKFPKRLARDIILSNDIGRDTKVDPFAQRDITKLFGDHQRIDRGLTTVCFSDKPKLRHTPSPVDMVKETGRERKKSIMKAGDDDAPVDGGKYNPTHPSLTASAKVSFTKDSRWRELRQPTTAQLRKEVIVKQKMMQLEAELQRANVSLEPPPMLQRPDVQHVPGFAGYSSRPQSSMVAASRLADVDRFTVFPWERKNRLEKKAVELEKLQAASGSPAHGHSGSGAGATTARHTNASGRGGFTTHRSTHTGGSESAHEEDERWQAERKMLLQKMGLATGPGAKRFDKASRKKQSIRGADFSSTVSRDGQKLFFHQPAPEVGDLSYHPNHGSTTRARALSADVRIARYSSRDAVQTRRPFTETVDNILQFENLLRFHQRQKLRAKESVFALPDQEAQQGDLDQQLSTITKADDFNLHPESIRPPQRSFYPERQAHSPSIFLYSDRPGSTVAKVVGGAAATAASVRRGRQTATECGVAPATSVADTDSPLAATTS